MESLELLQTIWFIIIGIFFLVYTILDGFDLGIGSLLFFLAKDEKEKKVLFNSIAPFWDGNEVWIIAGGALLFAAFPYAYATVFSGFYLALILVLFALIFRAVSLEFWSLDEKRKKFWEWAFVLGSLIPSLLYGVALGNIIIGIPLDKEMNFTGNFFTLLRPYPLVIGLLGLVVILIHGCNYATIKTNVPSIQERARKINNILIDFFLLLIALSLFLSLRYNPKAINNLLAWIAGFVTVFYCIMLKLALKEKSERFLFFSSSMMIIGLWSIVGTIQFPNLVKGLDDTLNITIYNASSSLSTLKIMLIIFAIGMPLIVGYSYYLYKIFKGKINLEESWY